MQVLTAAFWPSLSTPSVAFGSGSGVQLTEKRSSEGVELMGLNVPPAHDPRTALASSAVRNASGGDGDLNRAVVRALLRSRFDERGRLFVITGRRTFSAAQMLIGDLEKWTSPVFVGEPSASRSNHYGDSRLLELPNHPITLRVSTLWWQWDPRDTRPWIDVEFSAPLTVDAYRDGRDPALEAIAAS